jgi:hypothetical protein
MDYIMDWIGTKAVTTHTHTHQQFSITFTRTAVLKLLSRIKHFNSFPQKSYRPPHPTCRRLELIGGYWSEEQDTVHGERDEYTWII